MNKKKTIFLLSTILLGCLFVLTVLDFTALHDIHNEYISKAILEKLEIRLSEEVPLWTDNNGEWSYLNLSLLLRMVGYTVLLILSVFLYKKENNKM